MHRPVMFNIGAGIPRYRPMVSFVGGAAVFLRHVYRETRKREIAALGRSWTGACGLRATGRERVQNTNMTAIFSVGGA